MSRSAKNSQVGGSTGQFRRVAAMGAQIAGLLMMLVAVWLWYDRADPVRRFESSPQYQRTRQQIRNDDDLLKFDAGATTPMLGGDWVVLDALRRNFPPGTRVFVDYRPDRMGYVNPDIPAKEDKPLRDFLGGRTQRLWLAMLPDYPIVGSSDVIICPLRYKKPDYRLVQAGPFLALYTRGGVTITPKPPAPPAPEGAADQTVNWEAPLLLWLLMGLPAATPLFLRRRWDLGLCLLPFGGCLALIAPWLVSALAGTSVAGWSWALQSTVASVLMGACVELALRLGKSKTAALAAEGKTQPFLTIRHVIAVLGGLVVAIVAWNHFASGLVFCRGYPPYQWDGYAIWLLRAKLLAGAAVYPVDVGAEGAHLDYPLVLPALLGWFKRAGGMDLLHLSSATGLVAAVIPLAAWAGMLRRIGGDLAGLVVLAPFGLEGFLWYQFGAYADPLLTMAGVYGLVLCLIGVRDRDRCSLLAGGLVLAVAVATKNEGAMWVLCSGVLIALYALDSGRGLVRSVGAVALAAVPAIIFFAAWSFACKRIGVTNDLAAGWSTALVSTRLEPVLTAVWGELSRPSNLFLWIIGVLGMLLVPVAREVAEVIMAPSPASRGREFGLILVAALRGLVRTAVLLSGPALYVAGMIVIYLTTPNPLEWHLGTSLSRVMYLVPPAVLAMIIFARAGAGPRPSPELAPAPAAPGGAKGPKRPAKGQT
ncbi:MAG: hypothetical protein ACE15C_04550 [Phycisphaerae bacterium]